RALHGGRRVDRLELHAVDADPPASGRFVEHPTQLPVDLVTGGEGLLQVHRSDDVTQGGDRELFDTGDVVGDLVGRVLGVGHGEVDDRVDGDHEVVAGDHRLGFEGDDLLTQVDSGAHLVDERDEEVQPGVVRRLVPPEPLDDERDRLRNDPDRFFQGNDDEQYCEDEHYCEEDSQGVIHIFSR